MSSSEAETRLPKSFLADLERNAWPLVNVQWSESQVCFDCPCGVKEHFIDTEPVTCDCGRVYRLSVRFTVQETNDDRH